MDEFVRKRANLRTRVTKLCDKHTNNIDSLNIAERKALVLKLGQIRTDVEKNE